MAKYIYLTKFDSVIIIIIQRKTMEKYQQGFQFKGLYKAEKKNIRNVTATMEIYIKCSENRREGFTKPTWREKKGGYKRWYHLKGGLETEL